MSISVFDNASQDDMTELQTYAEMMGISIVQSGFTTQTELNSHGEILSRFVLEHPRGTHYLFLDADVCFVQQDTLHFMLRELEESKGAFGIGARMARWGGTVEIPREYRDRLYHSRLHPCCALVKNTELFRRAVKEIGLSGIRYCWARGEEYLDTFELMTKVMKTHGLRHILSSKMVIHFFSVSYDRDSTDVVELKEKRRDKLLREYRRAGAS